MHQQQLAKQARHERLSQLQPRCLQMRFPVQDDTVSDALQLHTLLSAYIQVDPNVSVATLQTHGRQGLRDVTCAFSRRDKEYRSSFS